MYITIRKRNSLIFAQVNHWQQRGINTLEESKILKANTTTAT